ncbi:helix-turn-helix domain-containing protein [Streptomyces sp. NPDC056161]|uniref:helix-turn-helix domain-containing protein n=1 Tax=Streptomyces sp. NPDC056161 TaxID=3345732 RepID=UPI0035D58430
MTAAELPRAAAPAAPSPPPGVVVVGHFDQDTGYGVNRPDGASSWLFTWTTGGRGLVGRGTAGVYAGAGDLVVLAPGAAHRYAVAPGARHWRFWWTHCPARPGWTDRLGRHAVADGLYAVTPVPDGLHDRVGAAFGRMLADARWTGAGAPPEAGPVDGEPVSVAHSSAARDLALCALEEIVLLTTGAADRPTAPTGLDARVRRAEEVMAADPGAAHTVGSLAADVALSPSRFAHLFTRQTGRSPMRALREARLRHAVRLLEGTDLTVERVAGASGFPSPFHFSRVFRARYGLPPGAYRSRARTGT